MKKPRTRSFGARMPEPELMLFDEVARSRGLTRRNDALKEAIRLFIRQNMPKTGETSEAA